MSSWQPNVSLVIPDFVGDLLWQRQGLRLTHSTPSTNLLLTNPLLSKFSWQINQSIRYVLSCPESAILIKASTDKQP